MEFGVVGLEGLVSANCSAPNNSSDPSADTDAKGVASGFRKPQRSGFEEDDWRALKMPKTEDFSPSKTMTLHQSNEAPPRSNALLSVDLPQGHMLSFSSNKPEPPFICKDDGAFPYYQHEVGTGSLVSANMHGHFAGIRGPFTPSQWSEFQQHALIYKYIRANVSVPSNLLNPIKRSFNAYGLSYASNSFGWGCFHLGFSGNPDSEPGRCRRTDGKKWRCSRDAVADQKYCERHINRGHHRSRKPVEGQTGHAASGTTNSNTEVVPPMSSSVKLSLGDASNGVMVQQNQFQNVQPSAAAISPSEALVNRMQQTHSEESTYPILKQDSPFPELTPLEFGLVSSDSLLNPSQGSLFMTSENMGSFLDFSDQESQDQHPLRQFMDDWPKDQCNHSAITWPEELKPDWTQLAMSIPMGLSDFSSSSPAHDKPALSPLRLSQEDFGDLNDHTPKHTNWVPDWWKSSMGGPLGEVLTNSSKHLPEGPDSIPPQLGSSPTGVLQTVAFGSLSNSSSGSSPRADIVKIHDRTSFFDNVSLRSSLASASIPSL